MSRADAVERYFDANTGAFGSRAVTYRALVFEREPTPAKKAAPAA